MEPLSGKDWPFPDKTALGRMMVFRYKMCGCRRKVKGSQVQDYWTVNCLGAHVNKPVNNSMKDN